MIKFAVCDDESNAAEYVSNKLREYYPGECEIKKYTDGKSLLEDSKRGSFNAFFLDAEMPSISGFEIAEQIRINDSNVKIIFVSEKEELANLGYIYGAFRFVSKNRLNQELRETAKSLYNTFSSSNEYLFLKTWAGEILVDIRTIRYFKADGHSLISYGLNEERVCYTMHELENILSKKGFIRIHKSYLMNFRYFYSIDSKSIKLSSGEELPISRNRISEVKQKIHECFQLRVKL